MFCKYAYRAIGRYVISVIFKTHMYAHNVLVLNLDTFAELSGSFASRRGDSVVGGRCRRHLVLMPGHSGQVGCGFGDKELDA